MAYGRPDRAPSFEEGLRDGVRRVWHEQGLPLDTDLGQRFLFDAREEIEPDLEARPALADLMVESGRGGGLAPRWDADDPTRLPVDWDARVQAWQTRDHPLMLRIHRGFLQTLGVQDSASFTRLMYLLIDDPIFVRTALLAHGQFATALLQRIARDVELDALIFSEPIAGDDRALISPRMYRELVLPGYAPVLAAARGLGISTIILRTYANPRVLLPAAVAAGFNCLWAVEANPVDMDYRDLRARFGRDLRLIGGIDLDALRHGAHAIHAELETKVAPLLADGGYVPVADGRVREDIRYDAYLTYRRRLETMLGEQASPRGR